MNLGFKTKWENGEPTYFVEKIWSGLNNEKQQDIYFNEYCEKFKHSQKDNGWSITFNDTNRFPKIHTIREDKSNRWKVGNKIHFVINNRQPNRFQFAPVIECTGIQYIRIRYFNDYPIVYIGNTMNGCMPFYWENKNDDEDRYGVEQMKDLALNDGFKSLDDFFKYFDKDFTGKIIHWTNKIY
mgnify:FL=1